ncbi:MAG: ribose 5-phosphate isomerase B [Alphaproteobacteria bacterium]|nr:ribose 5-phosphate isomerase B [Alphaproteobacteria bacterium]
MVAIGSDHAGVALKSVLIPVIEAAGYSALDCGTHSDASVDYPDYGAAIAQAVLEGKARFGVAICGSGIGISIAANRFKGIRAALCHSGLGAELSRRHNDANVLALGARLIGEAEAKECIERFLTTDFEGGRHAARVETLDTLFSS